jgi:hypothetical protein
VKFSDLDSPAWSATLDELRAHVRQCSTLEQAAQHIAQGMHERFANRKLFG